ncbi:efflux RND transporter periplasmic adaptor subunit [candidate division KSB1 bacterium]|nr:efflux RND transporter periplasmic adaptor subunit [candidate division KSB1 bacterium]
MKKQNQHAKTIKAATLLLLAAGLLSALAGCSMSNANSNSIEVVAVRTARVETANIAPPIRATGILSGKAESKLSFKIGGIIDRIVVSEGQSVRRGQLLTTLKLAEINAQVHQAQNAFDKAGRDLQRVKNLYRDSVATLEQLQDATTGYEVAKSSLEIAEFNRQYASIYAPAAGKILKCFAEANELVSPGTPVLLMRNAQDGWVVKAGLADRDVVRVAIGDTARLTFDAYSDQSFFAAVSEISGTASPMTGTYEVELKVDPAEGTAFLSGMMAKVEILPARKSLVSLVPIEALIEADGSRGNVYIIASPNVAKKIGVSVAFIHDQHAAIAAGLDGIAEVITDGAAYLTDGDAIKIVP